VTKHCKLLEIYVIKLLFLAEHYYVTFGYSSRYSVCRLSACDARVLYSQRWTFPYEDVCTILWPSHLARLQRKQCETIPNRFRRVLYIEWSVKKIAIF